MSTSNKVLMVDDEVNILEGYARELHGEVALDTATSGAEGLAAVKNRGPYAVIISDFKMPRMNGVEFLSAIEKEQSDAIRMMLTGYADMQIAIDAVNKGHIFRLLTKPCTTNDLLDAIQDGQKQYQLIYAERVLLEETLSGSIKVLTEVLSLSNPTAFSRATRLKRYVRHIATWLELPNVWEFELAALLSHIGCVTFERSLLEKIYANEELTSEESGLYAAYPELSARLIDNIPRLESIAKMIECHQQKFVNTIKGDDFRNEDRIALGGYLIKVAMEVDRLVTRNLSVKTVILRLRKTLDFPSPSIIKAIKDLEIVKGLKVLKSVLVAELDRSMIFDEDVHAKDGMLLVSKGQEATLPLMGRLRNYANGIGVVQPFRVIISSKTRKR